MFGLLVASSYVSALDKSAENEHYVEESFPTDPEDDEIIPLNEENPLPEYSQTEDTAAYDDFRVQEIVPRRSCSKRTKRVGKIIVHECSNKCRCKWCVKCVKAG